MIPDHGLSRTAALTLLLTSLPAVALAAQHAPPPGRASATVASRGADKHMLFRVHGTGGATVYLLGSVHLLSADAATLPPEVDTAFAHAKTVAFETSLDTVMIRGQELMAHARYANGATLRTSLSPASLAKLDTILPEYGLSLDQVNGFKPWMVAIVLTQLTMQRANFQPQYGVDAQINAKAHEVGKPTIGLESVDFQLGLFDALSPADQERLVIETRAPDEEIKELGQVKDAWSTGNTAMLDSLLNSRMRSDPALLAALVTNRNRDWVPKIESMLKGSDDVLVVVGAGHLVGKQGVVELLRTKGYKVEQL